MLRKVADAPANSSPTGFPDTCHGGLRSGEAVGTTRANVDVAAVERLDALFREGADPGGVVRLQRR